MVFGPGYGYGTVGSGRWTGSARGIQVDNFSNTRFYSCVARESHRDLSLRYPDCCGLTQVVIRMQLARARDSEACDALAQNCASAVGLAVDGVRLACGADRQVTLSPN